jgi:sulfite exporter TauE/SafE
MLALFTAVLLSSLLGSSHCAGMCVAFVAFAVGSPDASGRAPSRFARNAAYNGGRLATYMFLGAVAGLLGAALDLGGSLIGVQRVAACGAGAIMIAFGTTAVLRHLGIRISRPPVPSILTRIAKAGHERAFELSPLARAGTVGLLTTLLPCGWLYAFVVIAAGTASPLFGLVVMASFWLGTLPIMATLGFGVQAISGPLRKRLPMITSLALVGAGTWTLFGRMSIPSIAIVALPAPIGVEEAIERASTVDSDCPLCSHGTGKEP